MNMVKLMNTVIINLSLPLKRRVFHFILLFFLLTINFMFERDLNYFSLGRIFGIISCEKKTAHVVHQHDLSRLTSRLQQKSAQIVKSHRVGRRPAGGRSCRGKKRRRCCRCSHQLSTQSACRDERNHQRVVGNILPSPGVKEKTDRCSVET